MLLALKTSSSNCGSSCPPQAVHLPLTSSPLTPFGMRRKSPRPTACREHQAALKAGVAGGVLQLVGTDHAATPAFSAAWCSLQAVGRHAGGRVSIWRWENTCGQVQGRCLLDCSINQGCM